MRELFLHYLWRYKLVKSDALVGSQSETLDIISFGMYNKNAGPDFLNCKIKINNTLWAGNIEIHVKSSDWYKHGHHLDAKYDNIILHVVYEDDMPIYRKSGEQITTLTVKGLFDVTLFDNYEALMKNRLWVPCEKHIAQLDLGLINIWKEKLLIERLTRKYELIKSVFSEKDNDWNAVFYEFLLINFGFKVNALPFEMLAKSLPFNVPSKHSDNIFQLEALLYGQAGFLHDSFTDPYPQKLHKEYVFLKQKFSLRPINSDLWKLSKMRPVNFPFIRLAQLAQLMHKSILVFSEILEVQKLEEFYKILEVETSEYWEHHYVFDKKSKYSRKSLGKDSMNNLIINTFVPFIFAYAHEKKLSVLKERALCFLEEIKPEKNNIVTRWDSIGIKAANAYDTQALIELKNGYCKTKKCLECMAGTYILRNK